MIVLGVDNGLSGGLVAINHEQKVVYKAVMPIVKGVKRNEYDVKRIILVLKSIKSMADKGDGQMFVVLEKSLIMPISGRISVASTAYGNGLFEGILSTMEIPYQLVRAKDWQSTVLKGMDLSDTKKASFLWCQRRFPQETWVPSARATKEHSGLTDSACMAYYGLVLTRLGV
jgi:hypothetical protein